MGKYFVSIGAIVPHNWEIEVDAKDEREAVKIARQMFEDDTSAGDLVRVIGSPYIALKGKGYEYVNPVSL